jgi:peptide/nickel transport system substrate-binding protein
MPSRARFLLAGAALALLASCARRSGLPARDTLVVALESAPLHLDPRLGTDQASWRVADVVFNGLLKKGPGGTYQPDLAESIASEDAVTWKVRLKRGVLFHDGRELTSGDVAYTYRSLLAPGLDSGKKQTMALVSGIETPNPYDVVFRLREPYASFPSQLLLGIVREGTGGADGDAHPVGTGPYRLVESVRDERLVFAGFERCFDGPPRTPRLVYRIVPDSTTRALELLHGGLDLAVNSVPPDVLPVFRRGARVAVDERPGSTYFYLAFNMRDPVLSDVRVRRALALALDRDALVSGLWRGTVAKTETLLPEGHWARCEDLPVLTRDLAAARRLLDEAGYPDPGGGRPRLTLTYKTSTDEMSLLQATAIASQWREAGVLATIRSNDFAVFYEDVVRGSFQLYSLRWQGISDPDHFHEVFATGAVPPAGWNRGFFSDGKVDSFIEEARRTLDPARRRPLYEAIQRRVAEELPYVSLYTARNVVVHAPDLSGLDTIDRSGDFTFLRNLSWPRR